MDSLIIVRNMTLKDIDYAVNIEKSCFPIPWTRGAFTEELKNNKLARYYVAEIDNGVVAYGGMWLVFDEAHITNIAVHPDYQGRGAGKRLVEKLINESTSLNIRKMTLEVRRSNLVAIELYKNYAFMPCGVRPGYYEDNGEDALIMWKDL